MARRREKRNDNPVGQAGSEDANQAARLTNLLALLLIKGEPQADQIKTLSYAGFTNTEIARLLGLTPNAVNIALHRLRQQK